MNIRLLNSNILVRPDLVEEFSTGGIALPPTEDPDAKFKGDVLFGTIVSVGPGKRTWKRGKMGKREEMWELEAGQRVAFSPRGNHSTKVTGEALVVLRRDAVIGAIA